MPVIPHFSNECIESLNKSASLVWPSYDEKLLEDEKN